MSKFTMASVKSFIRKNKSELKIKVSSSFDGMVDGCVYVQGAKFVKITETNHCPDHTMGISGVWFVGRGNDFVEPIKEGDKIIGFTCNNSCGSFSMIV